MAVFLHPLQLKKRLSAEKWAAAFDKKGRLVDVPGVLKSIQRGVRARAAGGLP